MTTLARIAANSCNALKSTGPKTTAGISVSRMNALSHGLRATTPVVPGEDPVLWEAYREAFVSDLNPVGFLECELAERAANLSWRLRRVSNYEAGVITRNANRACQRIRGESNTARYVDGVILDPSEDKPTVSSVQLAIQDSERMIARHARLAHLYAELAAAEDDFRFAGVDALDLLAALTDYLPEEPSPPTDEDDEDDEDDKPEPLNPRCDAKHTRFQLELGVPMDQHDEPERWDGWTAKVIRVGVHRVARSHKWPVKWTGARLLARAVRDSAAQLATEQAKLADLKRQLVEIEQITAMAEVEARRRAMVSPDASEVVMKYEGHIHRQLVATLHELERRQAYRSEHPPQPPAAIDVTLNAAGGAPVISVG